MVGHGAQRPGGDSLSTILCLAACVLNSSLAASPLYLLPPATRGGGPNDPGGDSLSTILCLAACVLNSSLAASPLYLLLTRLAFPTSEPARFRCRGATQTS